MVDRKLGVERTTATPSLANVPAEITIDHRPSTIDYVRRHEWL